MTIDVRHGDSRDVIASMADASVDSCVTDPPYALLSIHKRFANSQRTEATEGTAAGPYQRTGRGFMGQKWDTGEVAHDVNFWREVLRVLKPGAHLIAFGGTRTYHRLAVAVEDAGFEIRDQIGWAYGSGFPKSHNQGNGWGTALKPAWEPIVLARKPPIGTVAANVLAHGTGAINIDACRVGDETRVAAFTSFAPCAGNALGAAGTAALRRGTQGVPKTYVGRWPANLIHDGSDEVVAAFPEAPGQLAKAAEGGDRRKDQNVYGAMTRGSNGTEPRGDGGSAARFFYSAKADIGDRLGSKHPTVKPVDLMAYLCRLVTPPGGTVLDPFAGSGTTGMACMREGFNAILIEREAKYVEDIKRRIAHVSGQDAPLFASAK